MILEITRGRNGFVVVRLLLVRSRVLSQGFQEVRQIDVRPERLCLEHLDFVPSADNEQGHDP